METLSPMSGTADGAPTQASLQSLAEAFRSCVSVKDR
jgi:hypothetical protein